MKITEILMAEHAVFHNLFDHVETVAPRLKTLKVMEPQKRKAGAMVPDVQTLIDRLRNEAKVIA